MTEKQKVYSAIYTCLNCNTEKWIIIEWGKPMPVLCVNAKRELEQREAPECSYCGCRYWSKGHKPKDS